MVSNPSSNCSQDSHNQNLIFTIHSVDWPRLFLFFSVDTLKLSKCSNDAIVQGDNAFEHFSCNHRIHSIINTNQYRKRQFSELQYMVQRGKYWGKCWFSFEDKHQRAWQQCKIINICIFDSNHLLHLNYCQFIETLNTHHFKVSAIRKIGRVKILPLNLLFLLSKHPKTMTIMIRNQEIGNAGSKKLMTKHPILMKESSSKSKRNPCKFLPVSCV